MGGIITKTIKVTTTGSAGSASGEALSPVISGALVDLYVDCHASAPATTDITVSLADRGGNIWARANSAADALVAPRRPTVDPTNVATDQYEMFWINGQVKVAVAECDALTDAVVVYLRYIEED